MYGRTRPLEWFFAAALLAWGVALAYSPASFYQPGWMLVRQHYTSERFVSMLMALGALWLSSMAYNGRMPAPYLRALMAVCAATLFAEVGTSLVLTAWKQGHVSILGIMHASVAVACLVCAGSAVRDVRFIRL